MKRPAALNKFLDVQQQVHLLFTDSPDLSDELVSRLPESSNLWQVDVLKEQASAAAPSSLLPI